MDKNLLLILLVTLAALVESARFPFRRNSNAQIQNSTQKETILQQNNNDVLPLPSRRNKSQTILRPKKSWALQDIFNVYDPAFLALVWPKITNGVHVFIEPHCWRDLDTFFAAYADGRAWAYGAVDASGRYESGLFEGNRYWLGSKQECLRLDKNSELFKEGTANRTFDTFHSKVYLDELLQRKMYFEDWARWRSLLQRDDLISDLVNAEHSPPFRLAYSVIQLELNLTKPTMADVFIITLGVCLPRSCSENDVGSVVDFSLMLNDYLKNNKTIPRSIKTLSIRPVEDFYDISTDIGALLLICLTVLLIIIAVAATAVDLNVRCKRREVSFDIEKFNNKHFGFDKYKYDENTNHPCDTLKKKDPSIIDTETLTINNINNSNNINLVTVKKVLQPNAMPPSITLDVVSMDKVTGSCRRCGKYKKQCNGNNLRHSDSLPACPRIKSFASFTTEPPKKQSLYKSLFLCFSLRYSWKKLFNTKMANENLALLHVLKIVATFWVMFVHVAMIAHYISDNGGDINLHNNVYYIVATGTLAFDTLFFISGLFSAHHYFFLKSQYTVEELVSFGGVCGHVLQFVCFITNRAIRLLPSYALVIFLSGVSARHSSHTAALRLPEEDGTNCDRYWWRNLLYITTMFPKEEQCMQISWYLSSETQLHVFGALTLSLLSLVRWQAVLAAAAAGVLLATAADVAAAYDRATGYYGDVWRLYGVLVSRPLAPTAPYFAGTFAGWLYFKMDGELYLTKTKSYILWAASLCGVCACVGGVWAVGARGRWVLSGLRALWPLALLWPALASATAFRGISRRILQCGAVCALSRLSYGALLLHGVAARALLLQPDAALCAHTACVWWYWCGVCFVSGAGALVLALLVEWPACGVLRRLADRTNT